MFSPNQGLKLRFNVSSIIRKIQKLINSDQLFEAILINQGKILTEINSSKHAQSLNDYEWKIFSQWGEDGIIQFLIREIEIKNKTFIEFGVEDFTESNCRYLLMASDWKGFVIDGSAKKIQKLKDQPYYWKYDLQDVNVFLTAENINEYLGKSNFDKDLGVLSVDIDGNDYHVLSAIDGFDPRIIICEYNPYFGFERAICVPYDPDFNRTRKHFSNLYFGASIRALQHLLEGSNYTLIGTGKQGCNAFFVRNDLVTRKLSQFAANNENFDANFRESRDLNGRLSFLRGSERYKAIEGLPILNVLTGHLEKL